MADNSVVVGDSSEFVEMHTMQAGQIAVITDATWHGRVVIKVWGDDVDDPFIMLHDGDAFHKDCRIKVRILLPGETVTITAG